MSVQGQVQTPVLPKKQKHLNYRKINLGFISTNKLSRIKK
jgi:hypothetical protein